MKVDFRCKESECLLTKEQVWAVVNSLPYSLVKNVRELRVVSLSTFVEPFAYDYLEKTASFCFSTENTTTELIEISAKELIVGFIFARSDHDFRLRYEEAEKSVNMAIADKIFQKILKSQRPSWISPVLGKWMQIVGGLNFVMGGLALGMLPLYGSRVPTGQMTQEIGLKGQGHFFVTLPVWLYLTFFLVITLVLILVGSARKTCVSFHQSIGK